MLWWGIDLLGSGRGHNIRYIPGKAEEHGSD